MSKKFNRQIEFRFLYYRFIACLLAMYSLESMGAKTTWNYVSDYDNLGLPTVVENVQHTLSPGLLGEIYQKLPERLDIRFNSESQITNDEGANLRLLEDAEVKVLFLAEGAGYRNAIGYFTFDSNNKPTSQSEISPTILFPNFSGQGSGGSLQYGDAINLGHFTAGTSIGFNVVSNGWNDYWQGVNPWPSPNRMFTTLKDTNPEFPSGSELEAHTVLLIKDSAELGIIGMEDINRTYGWSDHDFNDAIIGIQVTPFSALDRTHTVSFDYEVDTDGDGVPDYIDQFPLDANRVSRDFYPSASGFGRLAFEDNWPNMGDFDMNDLVVSYRVIKSRNIQNQISDLTLVYEFNARGALLHNGFGVHLEGISKEMIETVDANPQSTTGIRINQGTTQPLRVEDFQTEAVFIVSGDIFEITESTAQGCSFFNTQTTCPVGESVRIELDIHFTSPLETVSDPPFNPFLFRSNYRGLEVHLVDKPPTDRADINLLNTSDDTSSVAYGRYYRTSGNLPWALDIPDEWEHPIEGVDILHAYPNIQPWVESGGATDADWHVNGKVPMKTFNKY